MAQYTMTQVRRNLAAIVRALEVKGQIELTRRGEPVAMLLSMDTYHRLTTLRKDFWGAYQSWRQALVQAGIEIEPEVMAGVRDRSSGRDVIV